jgi:hypothetical protein
MQWILAFLDPPPRVPQTTSPELDDRSRVEALNILARLIAQARHNNQTNGGNR